jgi:hypothetical protein
MTIVSFGLPRSEPLALSDSYIDNIDDPISREVSLRMKAAHLQKELLNRGMPDPSAFLEPSIGYQQQVAELHRAVEVERRLRYNAESMLKDSQKAIENLVGRVEQYEKLLSSAAATTTTTLGYLPMMTNTGAGGLITPPLVTSNSSRRPSRVPTTGVSSSRIASAETNPSLKHTLSSSSINLSGSSGVGLAAPGEEKAAAEYFSDQSLSGGGQVPMRRPTLGATLKIKPSLPPLPSKTTTRRGRSVDRS